MTKVPWLIWTTYNSFPKISENKTENRSKNTRPRKILCGRVFYILFCIVFSDISRNGKHAAASLGSCEMILQNNFELQKRGRVFSLVLKIQLFQIT